MNRRIGVVGIVIEDPKHVSDKVNAVISDHGHIVLGRMGIPKPEYQAGVVSLIIEGTTDEIIEKKGLKQITDSSAIEGLIDGIIAANPKQVEEYRSGKDKLFGFFVGQAMKASKGKANPEQLNAILKQKLEG